MFIHNVIASCFKTLEVSKISQFIEELYKETNLYREMLGLCKLKRNSYLDKSAMDFATNFIEKTVRNKDNAIQSPNMYNLVEVMPQVIKKNFTRKIFHTYKIDLLHSGRKVVQAWQLSDENNQILISGKHKEVGYGVCFEEDIIDRIREKSTSESIPELRGVYVIQEFLYFRESFPELSEIKITKKIRTHLKLYPKHFCKDLNSWIIGPGFVEGFYAHEVVKYEPIYDKLARTSLYSTMANDKKYRKIESSNKEQKFVNKERQFNLRIITFRCSQYIPSCRLINTRPEISSDIRKKLKEKKYTEFGMKVKLLADKSFYISLVFVKPG
ncbi:hypothetical protein CDIK_2685 [Cucumispora dikerogammari]|nr:hypothetical protein CDIK_2685 [Cucumispora dikerogammari]